MLQQNAVFLEHVGADAQCFGNLIASVGLLARSVGFTVTLRGSVLNANKDAGRPGKICA